MRPLLADAFEHHAWATPRLIDAGGSLSAQRLASPVPGAFGSIVDTLRHVVQADGAYLELLADGRMCARGAEDPDLDPERTVVRHRDDGSESHAPRGVRLAQASHHGSDHRSQVCTGLSNMGLEPPAIDVWDYADQDGRLAELPARPDPKT